MSPQQVFRYIVLPFLVLTLLGLSHYVTAEAAPAVDGAAGQVRVQVETA